MGRLASARTGHIDQMHQRLRALEVAQELEAEAKACVRAFDEPGDVSHREAAIVDSRTTPRLGVSVVKG